MMIKTIPTTDADEDIEDDEDKDSNNNNNKCIGDNTQGAACPSPNCHRKSKNTFHYRNSVKNCFPPAKFH